FIPQVRNAQLWQPPSWLQQVWGVVPSLCEGTTPPGQQCPPCKNPSQNPSQNSSQNPGTQLQPKPPFTALSFPHAPLPARSAITA
ncbi:MAG: hypothetical protein ACO4CG_14970, partial [Prochlorothrix sp.]